MRPAMMILNFQLPDVGLSIFSFLAIRFFTKKSVIFLSLV
jgi:hypothetical protein